MTSPADRQQEYYRTTAQDYNDLHVAPGDEHYIALEYVAALLQVVGAHSVLDVGSGTGRAVRFLRSRAPGLRIEGVEPVDALRDLGRQQGTDLHAGSGDNLPFDDRSFDVVIATGVMHHVEDPRIVVAEMTRVATKAVMISDSNRFGQGSPLARTAKLVVHRLGLWKTFDKVRTKGRGYLESDTDGVYYSYSVFDQLPQLTEWGDRTFVIPTTSQWGGPLGPITAASHGLIVSMREPTGTGWAGM